MKIIWTNPAKNRIKAIYLYYREVASLKIAQSIKDKIFTAVRGLNQFKQMGQEEELLKEWQGEYRYIVEGNYKIIYKVIGDAAYILDVFDTRQNPDKLKQ